MHNDFFPNWLNDPDRSVRRNDLRNDPTSKVIREACKAFIEDEQAKAKKWSVGVTASMTPAAFDLSDGTKFEYTIRTAIDVTIHPDQDGSLDVVSLEDFNHLRELYRDVVEHNDSLRDSGVWWFVGYIVLVLAFGAYTLYGQ